MFKNAIGRLALRALKYSGIPLRDPALAALFGVVDTASGQHVDEDTALNVSTVFSATSLISSSVAALPFHVYDQHAKGDDRVAHDHIVNKLLAVSPSEDTTPYTWRETITAHAVSWGNGYARIERHQGLPVALNMLFPSEVSPERDDNNNLIYKVEGAILKPADILHIPGLGFDNTRGYSVVNRAREAVGLAIATEDYGAQFFGRGATPRTVVTHPGNLTKRGKKSLKDSFERNYNNAANPHGVTVLDEGMKVETIGLPPEDSQFLATRQFQVSEIARWFRVPPSMLYDLTGGTFNNVEQQNLNYLMFTLVPWLTRWRQEVVKKLMRPGETRRFVPDFDPSYLLQADMKTRYDCYNIGRNGGWLNLDYICKRERLPLIDGEAGQQHLAPSTMRTLESKPPVAPLDPTIIAGVLEVVKGCKTPTEAFARTVIKLAAPEMPVDSINDIIVQLKADKVIQYEK